MTDGRTGEPRSVSEKIKDATSVAAKQVKDVTAEVADKTSAALAGSGAVSRKVADAASSAAGSAYAGIKEATGVAAEQVKNVSAEVADKTSAALAGSGAVSRKVADAASSAAGSAFAGIKDATSVAAEQVKNISAEVADKTSSALAGSGAVSQKVADATFSAAGSAYAGMKDATSVAAEQVKNVSAELANRTSSALVASGAASRRVADAASLAAGSAYAGLKDATSVAAERASAASGKAAEITMGAVGGVQTGFRRVLVATVPLADMLSVTAQGLLASRLSGDLNGWLNGLADGPATIYDRAMDATFNATHLGGGYHRLFDGGHTIVGAFRAARGASPDDNIVQEALGTLQGLFRDGTTPRGLPLANWNQETFNRVAATLESNFGISKAWFYDLNTYDAAKLLGCTVGVLTLALAWNRADTETFAKLVGGMGLSAALSANPLLLVVTVAALAKAFHKARQTGETREFIDGLSKGGVGAGTTLAAVALVGAAGGPAGAALLAGVAAGVLANMAMKNVSVTQIGQFMAEQVPAITGEVKEIAASVGAWRPNANATV